MINSATPGRILNYVIQRGDLKGDYSVGEIRPAMVVRVWKNEYPMGEVWRTATDQDGTVQNTDKISCTLDGYNIQVFMDGSVDWAAGNTANDGVGILWRTSVAITETPVPGHLHWPIIG